MEIGMETGNIPVLPPPGMTKQQLELTWGCRSCRGHWAPLTPVAAPGGEILEISWDAAAAEAGLSSRNSCSASLGREEQLWMLPRGITRTERAKDQREAFALLLQRFKSWNGLG